MNTARIDSQRISQSIDQLIGVFNEFTGVLSDQIRAIVNQDFDSFNRHIERQLLINEQLHQAEGELKQELRASFRAANLGEDKSTLKQLIDTAQVDERLGEQRNELLSSIADAQQHQMQLLELMQFGQKQVFETIKGIQRASQRHETTYNQQGVRTDIHSGKMLNKQV